jgi:hypothetical protein
MIQSSLSMVHDAAAYIGVISHRYGQIPEDQARNPTGLSITELEFNAAAELGRPILLFIMGEKHPVLRTDVEVDPEKARKLEAFRERAKRMRQGSVVERVYEVFESADDFAVRAAGAIGRLARYLDQVASGKQILVPPPTEDVDARFMALAGTSWRSPKYDQRFGHKVFRFDLILIAPDEVLNRVQKVRYHLTPLWSVREYLVHDRTTNFRLKELAWGNPFVWAEVYIESQDQPTKLSICVLLGNE